MSEYIPNITKLEKPKARPALFALGKINFSALTSLSSKNFIRVSSCPNDLTVLILVTVSIISWPESL